MKAPNKDNTHATRWLSCLVATLLSTVGVTTVAQVQRSPLVVGIVIEGLSDEYLTLLESQFGEGGFRQLMHSGLSMSQVDYGPGIDATAATAIIYTGAAPSVNGIPAQFVYDTRTERPRHILLDASAMGNFTDETYSPAAIKVSTIADELRIATDGDGSVYSVAPIPAQAIISAGHAANSALWINGHTGNWATTTYYTDLPKAVTTRNYKQPLSSRLDTMKWVPLRDLSTYPLLTRSEIYKPFRHTYPSKSFTRYTDIKSTPIVNTEVTNLGIDLIEQQHLGADANTDMLNLQYTVSTEGEKRAEVTDCYLRLDMELARLFSAIDRTAQRNRATIFVVGVPARNQSRRDDSRWRIPSGEFSVKKATSLLSMYLMALHGNGDWVTGYHNKHFFLNSKLIKERNLDLTAFRAEVAEFLSRMSGVSTVHTIDDVIASRAGDEPQSTKRNTVLPYAGDVIIEINPGWEVVDADGETNIGVERASGTSIPAFILAPNLPAQRIDTPVDARIIAPTITRILRIRSPNGASMAGMHL